MRTGSPRHLCRKSVLPACLVVWALTGGVAPAQRLLTLGPELEPSPPGVLVAVPSASSVGGELHAVQVDMDLVRSAPSRLELLTPDGRVLSAELSVFEDRGGGDVMWSGRFPDADHDSVLLTIAGGRLAAHFGEPLGVKYEVSAALRGAGRMVRMNPVTEPDDEGAHWCGFGEAGHGRLPGHLGPDLAVDSPGDDGPGRVAGSQTDDELKILIVYTSWAVRYWSDENQSPGGVGTARLQHAADYLAMVFRNAELGLTPKVVFVEAPGWLNRVPSDAVFRQEHGVMYRFFASPEMELLRRRHRADLMHLFHAEYVDSIPWGGFAFLGGMAAFTGGGRPRTFVHETGHLLGGSHQPGVVAPRLEDVRKSYEEGRVEKWKTYAFAHAWHEGGTAVADGVWGDFGTAVAYPSTEPYFSTVRIRPGDQEMGIGGERENELAFRETVWERARQNVLDQERPLPPTDLRVEVTGAGSVRLAWTDNSTDEVSFKVYVRDAELINESVAFHTLAANRESLEIGVLPPGLYRADVVGLNSSRLHSRRAGKWFVVPGAEPEPPANVSVQFDRSNFGCRNPDVSWEDGFATAELDDVNAKVEVQILADGEFILRRFLEPGVGEFTHHTCLDREKRYGFRLYSHTSGGRSLPAVVELPVPGANLAAKLAVPPVVATGVPVVFDGSATVGGESYRFVFGDGGVVEHPNTASRVSHTYTRPGTFHARLEVLAGCVMEGKLKCRYRDVARVVVEVEPGEPPAADFDLSIDCSDGLCHTRTGVDVELRSAATGTVEGYRWRLGDGSPTPLRKRFRHRWDAPGFYRVTLKVWGLGEESTAMRHVLVRSSEPAGTCEPDAETLCLRDSRYELRAAWRLKDGRSGAAGVAHAGTNDSGLMWFFNPANVEMLVKVLDGCSVNGSVWVYGASTTDLGYLLTVTDTVTGSVREYRNEPGRPAPAIVDSLAFPGSCGGESKALVARSKPVDDGGVRGDGSNSLLRRDAESHGGYGPCGGWELCFQDERFRAFVEWYSEDGSPRRARRVLDTETDDSGLFYFYDGRNWEMLVKVLDDCAVSGHYWVFAASATDLGFDLKVVDLETRATRTYSKPPGQPAPAIVDTAGFRESCQP